MPRIWADSGTRRPMGDEGVIISHNTFIFGEFCRQLDMDIRPKSTAKAYQTRNTL